MSDIIFTTKSSDEGKADIQKRITELESKLGEEGAKDLSENSLELAILRCKLYKMRIEFNK